METLFLPASDEAILKAGKLLHDGLLVGFPTETVYGLGGNALDGEVVKSIFAAKGRPQDNPLIVHVSRKEEADALCHVTDTARKLMTAFWPGPLTLLMMKKPIIPDETTAGLPSVAVRCPLHEAARKLISAAGVPIAAPSANTSGRPSPTTAQHVREDLNGKISMILDGGPCQVGVESTVLDVTGDVPVILRPGAVTKEDVEGIVGKCLVADSVMRPLKEGEQAPSPGMRHRHYAPKGKMTIVKGRDEKKVIARLIDMYDANEASCILCHTSHLHLFGDRKVMDLGSSPEKTAHVLFSALRDMDEMKVQRILAEGWDEEGVGLAVMNRMARAAAFDIIEV